MNALLAGEVLAEFRGLAPADRDRVVKAVGDKVDVHESPWVCNLVVSFNTEKKPFDDARVRRALSLAVDRWGGAKGLSKIARGARRRRRAASRLQPGGEREGADAPIRASARTSTKSRAEARKLLAEAGVKGLKFKFMNRNVPQPYTYVGVFLVDQWRQIGVTAEHEQPETRAYIANLRSGNYEVGLDFNCDAVDDPNLQLAKYISAKRSPINYGRYTDEKLDKLYDAQQARARREEALRDPARVREARAGAGLHLPDHLVAPHHRDLEAAQGLAHVAEPLHQPGPAGRLAGSVGRLASRGAAAARRRCCATRRSVAGRALDTVAAIQRCSAIQGEATAELTRSTCSATPSTACC